MANENVETNLIPYYGYFNQLNHNNIADGGLCFTTDTNQEFFKLQNKLYPVLGQHRYIQVNMQPNSYIATVQIPNLDNAIINIFVNEEQEEFTKKYYFEFSRFSSNTLYIYIQDAERNYVTAHELITLNLYVQYYN